MAKLVGVEYTVIGWCKNRDILGDRMLLEDLLHTICERIGMRSLNSVSVDVELDLTKKDQVLFEDEGGSSALLLLSTSHASIHGWPKRDISRDDGGFFWLSISSCRPFVPQNVDAIIDPVLHPTVTNRHTREVVEIPGDAIEGISVERVIRQEIP